MTWWEEARQSIGAAIRLARFDAGGMNDLNLTLDGFWRSFGAALLLAPFTAIMNITLQTETEASALAVVAAETVQYAISWIAFPVLMIFVARLLGLSGRYVPFIIAYNWSNVVQVGLFFALTMLAAVGFIAGEVEVLVDIVASLFVLAYLTFIARTALGVPWATAGAIVVLDIVVSILLFVGTVAVLPGA
jgi:hypothetical protein